MSIIRELANLGSKIDSASSGESITKAASGIGTKAIVSGDVQGSAGTFTFTDSSYIANIISPSYITSKTGKAASLTGVKSMFQGAMPDLIPQTTATYNLGDSAKPIAELILHSGANLFLGTEAFTSILSSGTANNVGGGAGGGGSSTWYGDRGIVSGGENSGKSNVIEYFDITSPGNATDFGDLHATLAYHGGLSNTTYGLFAGGNAGSGFINNIQYITIATTGNTTDFGDMTTARGLTNSGCCNGTYGLWGATSGSNVIDRITPATPGNATDHGDLTRGAPANGGTGACASATNGIFVGGGGFYSVVNNIDYVAFATAANTTDWGDLAVTRGSIAASSNDTTAVFMGGSNNDGNAVNIIEYMSTASTGNASDFGDLTTARKPDDSGSANATRAVCCGGNSGGSNYNIIDYITIATPGNATDFGDCVAGYSKAGCAGN